MPKAISYVKFPERCFVCRKKPKGFRFYFGREFMICDSICFHYFIYAHDRQPKQFLRTGVGSVEWK